MASTYTSNGIELIGDGEQSNTWGDTTNTNWELMEEMVAGGVSIALTGTTYTLTTTDGASSNGRHAVVIFVGSPGGTCTVTVSPNTVQKTYSFVNNSDETVIISQGSGSTVSIPATKSRYVFCDGAGAGAAVTDISSAFDSTTLTDLGITATATEINLLDGLTSLPTVPSGAVFHFAMTSAPTGYLVCDGSAVSRSTYSELFSAIGTTFGVGDGSTTFNLPNLLGEFIRGYNGSGSGKDTGRSFGDQQDDAITEHNHYLSCTSSQTPAFTDDGPATFHGGHTLTNRMAIGDGGYTSGSKYLGSSNSTSRGNMGIDKVKEFDASSSTTATTETRPTNVALLACIKT